jgi:glycosyltransferase involved in cell wall biosynthesis
MVGVGPLAATLRRNLPPNVELRGWVDRAELAELYARASGFIHVAEEDFGMTMVEALASGTPVIAARRGGAPEIVRDGIDGLLLDAADPAVLRQAVESMAAAEWRPALLAERARAFSRERFLRELSTTIADRLAA